MLVDIIFGKSPMPSWFWYALATLFIWGVMNVVLKAATNHMTPYAVYYYGFFGSVLAFLVCTFILKFDRTFHPTWSSIVIGSAFINTFGFICLLIALSKGPASIVVPFANMHPIVAVLLGVVLFSEMLTLTQTAGVLLAGVSIVLLSR